MISTSGFESVILDIVEVCLVALLIEHWPIVCEDSGPRFDPWSNLILFPCYKMVVSQALGIDGLAIAGHIKSIRWNMGDIHVKNKNYF